MESSIRRVAVGMGKDEAKNWEGPGDHAVWSLNIVIWSYRYLIHEQLGIE